MKYQIVKNNKSGAKLVKLLDTLQEAKQYIGKLGLQFNGLSYIGGFPTFLDSNHKVYSIQGAVMFDTGNMIVCSLNQKEAESFL